MSIFGIIAAAVLSTAPVVDVPASPKFRLPPGYPSACLPTAADARPERVIVVYTVTRDGRTQGVRVRETTNPCFSEAAIAAARSWEFTPRMIDGRSVDQEDVETTLTFTLETPTKLFDFDARPILRTPPRYPERCIRTAADRETVLIEFDVTAEGTTENIRTVDTTNKCLIKSAEESVANWKYQPMIRDGQPAVRKGVQTLVAYELRGGPSGIPADRVRGSVWRALRGVNKYLGPDGDPDKALAELAKIEAKYGDSFTRAEQAAFHQLRGGARFDKKNYAGALDDLRIAQQLGAQVEDPAKFSQVLAYLERVVAAQQLAQPPAAPEPAPAEPDATPDDEE